MGNYPAETKQIMESYEELYTDIRDSYGYTDISPTVFEADGIRVLHFMVCLKPESPGYGTGLGAFVYKDGNVYQFHYNIHTPYSKGPHRSNQMTCIDRIVLDDRNGITSAKTVETQFGTKAFWDYTPMECLDPEAESLRLLMKSLQAYCRKENLCAKLGKLDKAHEKWKSARQAGLQARLLYPSADEPNDRHVEHL